MTDLPPTDPVWHNPRYRLPKRNQTVRVRTKAGITRLARFLVAYTDDWPTGASWDIDKQLAPLRFGDVTAWTDALAEELAEEPQDPAIVREVLNEIEHTRDLLALLPPDQLDWTPHPDIPSLQVLAWRLVRIVQRIQWIASREEVERSVLPRLDALNTPADVADTFSTLADDAIEILPSLDADALRQTWKLTDRGLVVVELPRGDVLRAFGVRPLVYHRAEMGLLLTALNRTPPHPYPEWELHPELELRVPIDR